MSSHRITGLAKDQLEDLVERVADELDKPWDKGIGRPRKLTLTEAVVEALVYLRHNSVQEVLGWFSQVSQPTVSRAITGLTPIVERVVAEFVPTEQEAAEAVKGTAVLVDGSLAPCWSWSGHRELWAGKHSTTGHNFQVITRLDGRVVYVSKPLPGRDHDMTAVREPDVAAVLAAAGDKVADKGYQGSGYITPVKKPKGGELHEQDKKFNAAVSSIRAPVERAVAHIKNWRILHTDYRRPLDTWRTSFNAAIGLFFFALQ